MDFLMHVPEGAKGIIILRTPYSLSPIRIAEGRRIRDEMIAAGVTGLTPMIVGREFDVELLSFDQILMLAHMAELRVVA